MIQRIQTIYLLISAIFSGGLIFIFHLWTTENDAPVFAKDNMTYFLMFLGSAFLSLILMAYTNEEAHSTVQIKK